MSAHILIEANFGLFSVGVLIDGLDHLANPLRRLVIELGAEVTVMESSDEGSDDLYFHDVGNRIPYLKKASDVATEELGRLLVDMVQIVLGARLSTRSHVIIGEDFFQLFLGFDGVRGKACKLAHGGWREHDGKIVHHDNGVSSDGVDSSGVSL